MFFIGCCRAPGCAVSDSLRDRANERACASVRSSNSFDRMACRQLGTQRVSSPISEFKTEHKAHEKGTSVSRPWVPVPPVPLPLRARRPSHSEPSITGRIVTAPESRETSTPTALPSDCVNLAGQDVDIRHDPRRAGHSLITQ
ncbi:MAG: hypothetical protein BJ554DRAFT_8198 [Olpidium bornovanus]|uniref:Uncharacterized protein n=1 Tax=Olpidium bornovanus TaxID=278681 RepID=A0A8H8DIN4_9FUNG|nr:MAG: hypothetical protein BJ554DRAFT_8198 [Olpidium bornovanus]